MNKYEVQEFTLCDGWINNWTTNGNREMFDTEVEAETALIEFLKDMQEAVNAGEMKDCPSREDFRIVEVK